MRICLIANPVSGGDARPRIRRAVAELTRLGASVDLVVTGARGDARAAAARAATQGYDRIVAAGGDGTLNEVANGVYPARLPIAFLPFGTVNVFALETGIPFDLEAACRLAVTGDARPISLGQVNDELFLLMTSVGWDAEAVGRLRSGVKRAIGRLAYGVAAVEALLAESPQELELMLADGTRHTGYGLVCSNCRYYGGRRVVTPQASLFSGELAIGLFRHGGRLAQLRYAARLGLGQELAPPGVDFYVIDAAEVRGHGRVQVDGDAWGRLPIRLRSLPAALVLILPAAFEG